MNKTYTLSEMVTASSSGFQKTLRLSESDN
jgi:hypothetical protein